MGSRVEGNACGFRVWGLRWKEILAGLGFRGCYLALHTPHALHDAPTTRRALATTAGPRAQRILVQRVGARLAEGHEAPQSGH